MDREKRDLKRGDTADGREHPPLNEVEMQRTVDVCWCLKGIFFFITHVTNLITQVCNIIATTNNCLIQYICML